MSATQSTTKPTVLPPGDPAYDILARGMERQARDPQPTWWQSMGLSRPWVERVLPGAAEG